MAKRPRGQQCPADVLGKAISNARSATGQKQEPIMEQPTKSSLAVEKARVESTSTDELNARVSEGVNAL